MPTASRKIRKPKRRDPIPEHFSSLEEAGTFWDTHDSAEYEDSMQDVEMRVRIRGHRYMISLDSDLYRKVDSIAKKRGISIQTLLNMWIQEKAS